MFFFIPLTTLCMSSVLPEEQASAAGLQNFVRTMSIAISTSVVLTIWDNAQRVSHNNIADKLQPDATVAALGTAGMSTDQSRAMINNLADSQALLVAVDHTFLVAAAVLVFAAAFVWVAPKPVGPVTVELGH